MEKQNPYILRVTNFNKNCKKYEKVVTNLVFVRKKKIKGKHYYFLVYSTKKDGKTKKFERYVGINLPSEKEVKKMMQEFDAIKLFLAAKKDGLENIKDKYQKKLGSATQDQLRNLEEETITKFTYDTNRIEGSTLTFKDTKLLLQEGISPREKPIRDIKEAENHKKAFFFVKQNLQKDLTKEFILTLHKILKKDVTEDAGIFRDAQVRVGDLISVKADMIGIEIGNLLRWYKKHKSLHPLELAAIFHRIFERIHPFFDGNGRIGRLLLNFTLMRHKYPLIIIQNKNKRRYYNALRQADNGNYLYMVKYLVSELEQQTRR